MSEYDAQRRRMVERQLVPRGISDRAVLEAFYDVPRHCFVPPQHRRRAYADGPLPIGEGQTISQPYMVAITVQYAALDGHSKVLEIGTGSGYQTAILAEICSRVYTIERYPSLLERTRDLLEDMGYRNICFRAGDGTLGWPGEAPFDAILVSAGSPRKPPRPLLEQLEEDGGRLVIPLQNRGAQVLTVITRHGNQYEHHEKDPCSFVPLVGQHGWDE
ncbi:MAG TPA: protein-L-isoaspartate(D-aspartate) O-methyltransferase [Acidobacteriota bacterium]|nr:protein-L-isoaspartate(D-aspartate) O-methyltransferase [Acidobacteriota bacterium]